MVKIVTHKLSGQQFRLPAQYTPQAIVGKGSYGVVCAAREKPSTTPKGSTHGDDRRVAIKRIKPVAGDAWDARHTLREVRLMRLLAPHPNVISLLNLVLSAEEGELYIVMELMDSDLHQIIQSKQELSEPHHKCLMYQASARTFTRPASLSPSLGTRPPSLTSVRPRADTPSCCSASPRSMMSACSTATSRCETRSRALGRSRAPTLSAESLRPLHPFPSLARSLPSRHLPARQPGNCLVSRDGQLRITDFGSRAAGAEAFPGKEGEGSEGYYNAAGAHGAGGLSGQATAAP